MFEFDRITWTADEDSLSATCRLDPALPVFLGHFPGRPLLPAVSQLALLQTLANRRWGLISGGKGLKFSRPLEPGDLIQVSLRYRAPTDLVCEIVKDGEIATKGTLLVTKA